ncbi:MAG: amino acid adenylation domain-containing protein [Desulfobacterales bacterium]|nr:amino acid adenylation domain-containing protein [Desulfobacterales bacterium]
MIQSPFRELSPYQERLWLLNKLNPDVAFVHSKGFILKGNFNSNEFKKAVNTTVNYYTPLKTTFIEIGSIPKQKINDYIEFDIINIDLADVPNNYEISKKIAEHEASKLLSIKNAPLFSINTLRINSTNHIILFNANQIIFRKNLFMILCHEIMNFYVHSEQIPIKYTFKTNQVKFYEQKIFWLNKLKGELPVLNIPYDFKRPILKSYKGNSIKFKLKPLVNEVIYKLSSSNDASILEILTSIIKILLYRYTGEKDIIIGTYADSVKYCISQNETSYDSNLIPLRSNLLDDDNFKTVLLKVKNTISESFFNKDYPFEMLIKDINIHKDLSHHPLFDIIIDFQTNPINIPIKSNNFVITDFDYTNKFSLFDISFIFIETNNEITFEINYNTDIFGQNKIQRIKTHFEELTLSIHENPNEKINTLNILSRKEKNILQFKFNHLKKFEQPPMTIVELFEKQVKKTPNNIALMLNGKQCTYEDLNFAANEVAFFLRKSLQVKDEELVGVILNRNEWLIIALLGILKAKCTYLPIYPSEYINKVINFIKETKCKILLTESNSYNYYEKVLNLKVIDITKIQFQNSPNPEFKVTPDNLAYVIHTSGSTGEQKGVLVQHKSFVNMILGQIKGFGIVESDHILNFSSCTFDASLSEIFMALLSGACLVLIKKEIIEDSNKFFEYIKKHEVSVITFPPAYLKSLRKNPLPSLRIIITAGDPPIIRDVNFYKQTKLYFNAYGPTETSVCCSFYKIDPQKDYVDTVPIGKPIPNSSMYILDKNLNQTPIGFLGEICISGDILAKSYLNKPELTKKNFIKNPYKEGERLYRTGDIGKWLEDGNIEFIGRIEDNINLKGVAINLEKISSILKEYSYIYDAIATTTINYEGNKELTAYIIASKQIVSEKMKKSLEKKLPYYMIPENFMQLDRLPLTSNGKIDKKVLPNPSDYLSFKDNFVIPNITQKTMITVWKKLLKTQDIEIFDDFFSIGGDSIMAIQMISMLGKKSIKINFIDIFRYKTIFDISKNL